MTGKRRGCAMAFWGAGQFIAGMVALCSMVFATHYRFTHPDLTETQLFMKCWHFYTMTVVAGLTFLRWAKEKPGA